MILGNIQANSEIPSPLGGGKKNVIESTNPKARGVFTKKKKCNSNCLMYFSRVGCGVGGVVQSAKCSKISNVVTEIGRGEWEEIKSGE